jgi:radical SAM superfamily enzyme YgiQ (UPF0313 family)
VKVTLVVPRIIEPESALLGPTSIASYVNQPDKLHIAVAGRDHIWPEDRRAEWYPDVVGISAWTVEIPIVRRLAMAIREGDKFQGPLLLGGHHVTLLPESLEFMPEFDGAVLGEAEQTIQAMVRAGHYQHARWEALSARILKGEELPIVDPAHYPAYRELDVPGRPAAILMSRGCKNRCRFCATQAFGRRLRFMQLDKVFQQLAVLAERYPGRKNLVIWDDCFTNMPIKRLRSLSERWVSEGWHQRYLAVAAHGGISWPIPDEVWDLLKVMNVKNLNCGFESGSDGVLQWLKNDRRVSVDNIKTNMLKARDVGIHIDGSFQFGAPGESPEDTMLTLNLMKWKIDNQIPGGVWWFVTCALPGTELWEMAKNQGKVSLDMDFSQLHLHRLENPMMLDDHYPRDVWARNLEMAKQLMAKNNNRPYYQA